MYLYKITEIHLKRLLRCEAQIYIFDGFQQKAQMGLISLTWVFCQNLVKIHLVIIEILSFSCSVLLLVKADGDHLAVPNCKKKSKWLNAKIIVTQSWYNSIERFFQFYTLLFLVRDTILTGLFLFLKQLIAGIILIQIWSKSIKKFLRYCHFHVLCYF